MDFGSEGLRSTFDSSPIGRFAADCLSDLGISVASVGELIGEVETISGQWIALESVDWKWGRLIQVSESARLEIVDCEEIPLRVERGDLAMEESFPVLDRDLWDGNLDLQKRLYSQAIKDVATATERIDVALGSGDRENLERGVHFLKGTLDVIGAKRFSEYCRETLSKLSKGEFEAAEKMIAGYAFESSELDRLLRCES